MNNENIRSRIYYNLEKCAKFYQLYLQEGKKFYLAELIYKENHNLIENVDLLLAQDDIEADLLNALVDLTVHVDVWAAQFRVHKSEMNPAPQDEFVFANLVSFPKAVLDYFPASAK